MENRQKTIIRMSLLLLTGVTAVWVTKKAVEPNFTQKDPPIQKLETTLFLSAGADGEGKVNRLGQQRNLETIRTQIRKDPDEIQFTGRTPEKANTPAWEKTPFPPLLVVKTNKNQGILELEGDLFTEKTTLALNGTEDFVKFHPQYNWESTSSNNEETLTLKFSDLAGKTIQQSIPITWSEPDEIFLSDNCLPHLAAITDTKAHPIIRSSIKTFSPTETDIIQWMKQTTRALEPYQIEYEEVVQDTINGLGWQKIREPQNILQERRGNCLDLSIFWAGMMLEQGLQTWIVIVPEHALVAVGPPNSGPQEAIILETTWLTGKNLKATEVENAIQAGHKRIREELSKNSQQVTIIDINYWKPFFQTK